MADLPTKKGSTLPVATAVQDADQFFGLQGGVTKRQSASSLKAYALSGFSIRVKPANNGGITDDSIAINAAITTLSASGGGVVELSKGVFYVADASSILVNTPGVWIRGDGRKSTAIINKPTAAALGVPLITVTADDFTLTGVRLNGGRAAAVDNKSTVNSGRFSLIAYDNTTRRGLKLSDCIFEDCRGKGVLWNAHDVSMQFCLLRRIGKYVRDVTPIDSAFTNWVLAGTPDNVTVTDCIFEYIGMFGSALKNVSNPVFERNVYRYMSAIGAGFQGCTGARVNVNAIANTFNSGIDLQQCADPAVTKNNLDGCGYGNIDPVTLEPRMYQAIFIGDDATTNSAGDSLAVGGVLESNTIRGYYVFGGGNLVTEQQTGCGITLVSTTGLTVGKNTIHGIGDRSVSTLVLDNKDGVGIKVANNNISLKLLGNDIFDTKSDGVMLGVGDLLGTIASENNIWRYGRHGINVAATTRVKMVKIAKNIIFDGRNTQSLAVAADIYIGISAGWLSGLTVSDNECYNTARESVATASATVYTTHGIYFKKLGSFAGLGTVLVKDNLSNGHLTKEIAFSDVFTISGKARYFNAFDNNRDGMTDNGTGIIFDIPNFPDVAIEFVGAAAPTTGQFAQGSKVWYPFPVGSDYVGAVCVASGSPGTWRKFGLISAVPG